MLSKLLLLFINRWGLTRCCYLCTKWLSHSWSHWHSVSAFWSTKWCISFSKHLTLCFWIWLRVSLLSKQVVESTRDWLVFLCKIRAHKFTSISGLSIWWRQELALLSSRYGFQLPWIWASDHRTLVSLNIDCLICYLRLEYDFVVFLLILR